MTSTLDDTESITMGATFTAAQVDRLQGELFSQLSLRCHEQNWAQVHAIAEQIAVLKREPTPTPTPVNRGGQDEASCKDGSAAAGGGADSIIRADGQGVLKSPLGSPHPNTLPHMLSTCLGTASPLAWTCRYSAPSSTVKLVLDLDLSAVRRCLPQLGTPLHECVGRPRPLRKMPLKQSCWTDMIRNSNTNTTQPQAPVTSPSPKLQKIATSSSTTSSTKKKKKQRNNIPRVLKGLHVWRRTVRALIQADEILMKEDAKIASATAKDAAEHEEDRRRAIQTMINENVTNINTFKAVTGDTDAIDNNMDDRFSIEMNTHTKFQKHVTFQSQSSSNQSPPPETRRFSIRATMAQDADGNTPLHFMIRGAAAPALGGVGWQAHHADLDDDEDDNEEEEENVDGESEMQVESTVVGEDISGQDRSRERNDYWGMNGSPWDGIRWCMEAHLRRVERRGARRLRWEKKMAASDTSSSDGKREIEQRVASVRIATPEDNVNVDVKMVDEEEDNNYTSVGGASDLKQSAKRKSLVLFSESEQLHINAPVALESSTQLESTRKRDVGNRKRQRSRRKKYFDEDEHQDCCYDPLLGAVRDLVYSCPEAVGIPDHREYEETPLIVALKSSIYVLMEPDTNFQVVERLVDADGIAAPQPPGGMDGEQNGDGFANFGGLPIGGGRDFLFPELGVLFHNRPMNLFHDDEAMMAVLRGHGRRSVRGSRRSSVATRSPPRGPENSAISDSGVISTTQYRQQGNSQDRDELEGDHGDDDHSTCSSVSDYPIFDQENDPRYDAFVPGADEDIFSIGVETPVSRLGLLPLRRPRYDYQTALEYRIFCLVRIMLDAYPRAACLMISDYTPLHSAVFHGRCPDTIRILLEAEAKFRSSSAISTASQDSPAMLPTPPNPMMCPTLPGPALLCTNTRGELPLHFACMSNQCVRSIRLLAGADPRAALVRDASGRTPLRWLWIRFVDGLLDRFGGRDTQGHNEGSNLAFQEQEGRYTPNFPNPGQRIMGMSHSRMMSMNDTLNGRCHEGEDVGSSDSMFVFDVGYISRTRTVDRTVDFLRMRHIPPQFENIENVAAEHAINVLLKLKYLQQRRTRLLSSHDSARSSTSNDILPPDAPMSIKEEFILCAFEKFTALIHATLIASEAEEKTVLLDAASNQRSESNADSSDTLSRKKLWNYLPQIDSNKRFFLVHEACRSSRASCPAAVARICIKLFTEQLFEQDDDGQLPLHKVACRGIGWEPPGSGHDNSSCTSLADETLTLLKLVLSESHVKAPETYDNNKQLPLHCAIDSLVTSLTMGKKRRATLHAEARVVLQKYRHTHVEIATECLTELLRANAQALWQRDGKTGLYPFMQAAIPHGTDTAVVKYTSDLSRRPGFDGGLSFHSMDCDVEEENDDEADCNHISIIYFLLREDPSALSSCC